MLFSAIGIVFPHVNMKIIYISSPTDVELELRFFIYLPQILPNLNVMTFWFDYPAICYYVPRFRDNKSSFDECASHSAVRFGSPHY